MVDLYIDTLVRVRQGLDNLVHAPNLGKERREDNGKTQSE